MPALVAGIHDLLNLNKDLLNLNKDLLNLNKDLPNVNKGLSAWEDQEIRGWSAFANHDGGG